MGYGTRTALPVTGMVGLSAWLGGGAALIVIGAALLFVGGALVNYKLRKIG